MEITRYKCELIQEDDTIEDFFHKVVLWTIVHGGHKLELAQKIHASIVDVKYMETNFGFRDFVPFSFAFKTVKLSL